MDSIVGNPDSGIPDPGGQGERSEYFQGVEGTLERPCCVPRIEQRTYVVRSGLLHQGLELPCLQVARVILDRDLDAVTLVGVPH